MIRIGLPQLWLAVYVQPLAAKNNQEHPRIMPAKDSWKWTPIDEHLNFGMVWTKKDVCAKARKGVTTGWDMLRLSIGMVGMPGLRWMDAEVQILCGTWGHPESKWSSAMSNVWWFGPTKITNFRGIFPNHPAVGGNPMPVASDLVATKLRP